MEKELFIEQCFFCICQVFPRDTVVLWKQEEPLFDEFSAWLLQALAARVGHLDLLQVHPEVLSTTIVLAAVHNVPLLFFLLMLLVGPQCFHLR